MAHQNDGGGADVATQVSGLSDEIEGLIGQLRGVEESWKQLVAPLQAWEDEQAENPALPNSTLVGRTFEVRGDYAFSVTYQFPGSEVPEYNDEPAAQIQSAMDAAFEVNRNTGTGALEFSRYVLTQVIEPDHAALADAARAMDDVAMWLYDFTDDAVPAFVETLRASWPATSEGSTSFYAFYEDLADVCTHYHGGAAQLAGATAAVSTVVRQYQDNLVDVLRAGRDQLVKALETWQSYKGPDQLVSIEKGDEDSAASVLGSASLIAGIVGLFPPAGLAAGTISVVTGIRSLGMGDRDVKTHIDRVSTVLDITVNLNEGLLALRSEMADALDAIGQGGSGWPSLEVYVNDVLGNPNWTANPVDLG